MAYWNNRMAMARDELLVLGTKEVDKKLIKEYKRAWDNIELKITRLYDKIMVDGKPSMAELYRFNRYYELMAQINSVLTKLGKKEEMVIGTKLTELYLTTGKQTASQIGISFSLINKEAVKNIINEVWCADGKSWSDRIWADKGKLQDELMSALMDCIIQGKSRDKVVAELAQRMGVSKSNANRLVRTELNHIQTRSAIDRYKEAGFEEYEILATLDKRTSEICRNQDGKKYKILQYNPGVTAPPFHPNCRTTIIPV